MYIFSETNGVYFLLIDLKTSAISQFGKSIFLAEPNINMVQGVIHLSITLIDASSTGKLFAFKSDKGTLMYTNWFENDAKIVDITPFRDDSSTLVLSSNGEVCQLFPQLYTCKELNRETLFNNEPIKAISAQGNNFMVITTEGRVY